MGCLTKSEAAHWLFGSALRGAGNDDGGNDISEDPASAQGAEQHPCKANHRGVNIKILGNAAADAVDHFIVIGFIQLLFHDFLLLLIS